MKESVLNGEMNKNLKEYGFADLTNKKWKPFTCLKVLCKDCPFNRTIDCLITANPNLRLFPSDYLENPKNLYNYNYFLK